LAIFRRAPHSAFQRSRRDSIFSRELSEPFQIERDEREAQRLQSRGDFPRGGGIEPPRKLVLRQFDARQLAMRAYAKLPEAKFAKRGFRALDLFEQLGRYRGTVRHARR
jgi:hypothetical protein